MAAGLPAIHATTILTDATTGEPRASSNARALTAHRTAAVSGLAIARWGPPPERPVTVALIGAGAQARTHLPVIAHLLPEAGIVICDRDQARLDTLRHDIEADPSGLGAFRGVGLTTDPTEALDRAQIVITMVSFGPERQLLPADAFAPDATIVAVDYDMCVPASVASDAALFLVDDREQYLANRAGAVFAGYPSEPGMIGDAIVAGTRRPSGRVLVTHLGVGLADIVFADAVLSTADERGIGMLLER